MSTAEKPPMTREEREAALAEIRANLAEVQASLQHVAVKVGKPFGSQFWWDIALALLALLNCFAVILHWPVASLTVTIFALLASVKAVSDVRRGR